MKLKNLFLAAVLTIAACISSRPGVKAGSPVSSSTIADAATIRGVVKFSGTVPAAKNISMSADPSCAKQHPGPVLTQEVVADSKGRVTKRDCFCCGGA